MAISLQKGGNVSLTKTDPGLIKARIGLGWDARSTDGAAFDLDTSVFLTGESGQVLSDAHFVFYNQKTSPDGAVAHSGYNLTGAGEGDDETVSISLPTVDAAVQRIIFAVTIHEAESRKQNFGMVRNAFMRVQNEDTSTELARFDLRNGHSVRGDLPPRGGVEIQGRRTRLCGRAAGAGRLARREPWLTINRP